ncbi:MAG: phage tail tape measure protein [Lachnospiraceae bacterium]|nr:phage tail tape measure protein [Lachnospiraceae bacterium]
MAYNSDADIALVAGLDEEYSESEILKVIKIIEKRLRANHDGRIKLIAEIDETVIKDTVNKLQSILKSKDMDLKIDTKNSIQALTREVNALSDVAISAKKASVEKLEFKKANEQLRESAEDSTNAINRERSAMESLSSVDDILDNINARGRQGVSIFQQWDDTIHDAFMAYTAANLLERALDGVVDAGKEAVEVIRDLNGEIVDLRMSTGDSYKNTKKLLSDYNSLGQDLGAITQDVSSAASDWLRQGHNIDDTNKLIRASMILSKISQMDSASATEYLTSSMKGYHVAVEDVIGIVDKLCTVDLSAAVSADGLANGMSRVAGVAESAGISMDKLLGYLAVIGETTQLNMGSVGNALKTIFLRMQDIKSGKLELIDEDGTVELLSDVEITLKNVGIDLRTTVNEFNNSGEVLDSLAEKWDTLSSVQQGALQKAFSGQRQGNMFRVLMENYETAKKYMEIASESAGASEEKFGYYLESLESKTNSLIASLQNLATTTIPDSLYASILDTSKAIVDAITETGLLKGALLGLTTSGSLYAFSQIATFVRDAAQGFSDLNEAMNMTHSGTVDIQRLINLTSGLSQSQTRLLLSTDRLDDAQRLLILTNQNLARGMNRDVAEATARATLNNMRLSTSTVTLTGVMRGLIQTIIANPYVAVASAVTALTMAYHTHNQKLEETKQKNLEASEKAVEYANSLKDLYTEYSRLSSIQERTASQEEELKNVIEDITEKLGDKASALEGLTAGTNEYAEALANLTKEELQSASVEATIGRKIAEEDLQKDVWSDLKGSKVTIDSNSKGKALSDEAQKAVDIVSDSLKEFETINRTWNNLSWDVTSDSPEDALEYYNALVQAREKLVQASEDDESLLETEIYKDLNTAITTMSDSLEEYINKKYEEEKLNYMAQNGIPQTVEEYNAMKKAMENASGASEGLKSKINDLLTADFSSLANSVNSVAEAGENLTDNTSSFNIETFSNTIQSYEDGYKRLAEVQEEWNEAKSISAETFAELQESGLLEYLDFTSEGLTINKDKLLENAQASKDKAVADLHASMMADMLKIALGNVDSVSEQAKTVIAQLGDNTEIAGQQALSSVGNWVTLGAVITDTMARARGEDRGFNGVSDEQKAQMESVYNYYTDIAEKVSAIDITIPTRTASASKAGKDTADAYVEAFEDELKNLQDLRDRGKISEATYLEHLRMLYMKYFADRKEYLDEFKKYEAEYLSGLKSLYGSALTGITDALDKQINLYEKQKEVAIESIEAERDARKEAIEEQIANIDRQIKAKQKQIKAIQAENREISLQTALQKVQYEAEQLRNNRTILQYDEEKGFHYTIDTNALREKEREVDEKKDEIRINNIEKEIDLLEERKSMLEEQASLIDKMYSKMIESTEKYWDSLIESMTNYKSRYEQLAELEATAKMSNDFKQLGIDIEAVLNMSEAEFQKFSNDYVGILADFYSGNEGMTNSLAETLGINTSQLGSYVNDIQTFAKETTDALSPLSENTTGIDDTTESVGKLSEVVNGIDSTKISSTTSEFTNLAEAIKSVTTALGLTSEDSVGGLLGALTSLSAFTLGDESTGIIAQFNTLKTAVDAVTSSISGSGSKAQEGGGLATGANGGAATPNVGNGEGSGLTGAITNIGTTTNETLGAGESENGESEEGEGVLGKFAKFKTAVDEVTKAIGTDEETDDKEANLISALRKHYEVAEETVPEVKGFFDELLASIEACVAKLGELAEGMKNLGGSKPANAQEYAKGTKHAKKGLAFVAEGGKPELIEDTKGNLSLATQPTLVNMEGGEKVYNGDETEKLLKPKQNADETITLADGSVLKPLDESNPIYAMYLKAQKYFAERPEILYPTQNVWSRQMEERVNSLRTAPVVNNNKTQTQHLMQNINVTLPNVTNETGFNNFKREMMSLQNDALQRSSITR